MPHKEEEKTKTKTKPRCAVCNKKVPILAMSCNRCKLIFCIEHRFPEEHDCQNIEEKTIVLPPAVTFSKLEKI